MIYVKIVFIILTFVSFVSMIYDSSKQTGQETSISSLTGFKNDTKNMLVSVELTSCKNALRGDLTKSQIENYLMKLGQLSYTVNQDRAPENESINIEIDSIKEQLKKRYDLLN